MSLAAWFILFFIVLPYGIYLSILTVTGVSLRNRKNKDTIHGVLIFLGLLPLLCFFVVEIYNRNLRTKDKERYQEMIVALKGDLKKACQAESVFTIHQKIPKKSGIFYPNSSSYKEYLAKNNHLAQKEALYEACDKEMDLIMKSNNPFWGYIYCDDKYNSTVYIHVDTMFDYLAKYSYVNNIEDTTYASKGLERRATREWWDKNYEVTNEIPDNYFQLGKKSELNQFLANTAIKKLMADYIFQVNDISTLDTRKKGLRKFSLSLTDRQTKELLSEYIVFDTINLPPGGSNFSKDNCVTLAAEPVNETKPHGNDDILRHFFSQAVAVE